MSDQSRDLLDEVRTACHALLRHGQAVTFPTIADQTGTSRATLYRRRELRALIDTYRDPTGDALTVTTLATHIDQLRHTLDAVAAKVRRHEEELRSLKHHARTEHAS
jgi:hypothetical protein